MCFFRLLGGTSGVCLIEARQYLSICGAHRRVGVELDGAEAMPFISSKFSDKLCSRPELYLRYCVWTQFDIADCGAYIGQRGGGAMGLFVPLTSKEDNRKYDLFRFFCLSPPPPKRILATPLSMSSELISCYGNHLLCHIFITNILIESYTICTVHNETSFCHISADWIDKHYYINARQNLFTFILMTTIFKKLIHLPSVYLLTHWLTHSSVRIIPLKIWQRGKNHTLVKLLQGFKQQVTWPTLLWGNNLRVLSRILGLQRQAKNYSDLQWSLITVRNWWESPTRGEEKIRTRTLFILFNLSIFPHLQLAPSGKKKRNSVSVSSFEAFFLDSGLVI